MLVLSVFGALPFGLAAFLWIGPFRLVWALHAQCFVNSICHMRKVNGPDEATAKNVPWLALMHGFQGENWHQNHHDRPGSARLGLTPAQLDMGWYAILLLEKAGLATLVRRPDLSRSLDAAA
jgi:stearoyl-CoA desaturase (delta-9 desaturase)